MGMKRIHEMAKEFGLHNQEMIVKLQALGFDVRSHSSRVDEEDVRKALHAAQQKEKALAQYTRVSGDVIRRRPIAEPRAMISRRQNPPAPRVARSGPSKEPHQRTQILPKSGGPK